MDLHFFHLLYVVGIVQYESRRRPLDLELEDHFLLLGFLVFHFSWLLEDDSRDPVSREVLFDRSFIPRYSFQLFLIFETIILIGLNFLFLNL